MTNCNYNSDKHEIDKKASVFESIILNITVFIYNYLGNQLTFR